jgi:hypothetical protein
LQGKRTRARVFITKSTLRKELEILDYIRDSWPDLSFWTEPGSGWLDMAWLSFFRLYLSPFWLKNDFKVIGEAVGNGDTVKIINSEYIYIPEDCNFVYDMSFGNLRQIHVSRGKSTDVVTISMANNIYFPSSYKDVHEEIWSFRDYLETSDYSSRKGGDKTLKMYIKECPHLIAYLNCFLYPEEEEYFLDTLGDFDWAVDIIKELWKEEEILRDY